jgi:hypothetical protein
VKVGALGSISTAARERPAQLYDWLPLQDEYLRSTARYRLLRTGNQVVGKTTCALVDLMWHATGEHPHRADGRAGPDEYWLLCVSWNASIAIQQKLWDILDKTRVHPETQFDARKGFVGQHPAVRLLHKRGGYSVIRIKTANQGGLTLASATVGGIVVDEPPKSSRIFTELMSRVERRGWLAICMTPVNADVGFLREIVDADGSPWVDIHRPLTPAELVPVGRSAPLRDGLGRPMGAEWIRERESKVPAHEVGIVVHGEWDVRSVDRFFSHWAASIGDPPPGIDLWAAIGVDHGSAPGKQTAVLIGCQDMGAGELPHVFALDEYTDKTGKAIPADDARGILAMLKRQGWKWGDLDDACGDRALLRGRAGGKSNAQLAAAINRQLGRHGLLRPVLRTAKRGTDRGAGSALRRARYVHWLTAKNRLTISPRCPKLLEAMDTWNGSPRHDAKDILDGFMYALDRWTFERRVSSAVRLAVGR